MEQKLCRLREAYRALRTFEQSFQERFGISFNEGMLLYSLEVNTVSSSGELAKFLGLSCSNTSKVIKSVEGKALIERELGQKDKRQMYFSLTDQGTRLLDEIRHSNLALPVITFEEGADRE